MNIRQVANSWFRQEYGHPETKFRSSKLYTAEESMANELSWWIEFNEKVLKPGEFQNLLCQKCFGGTEFYHLKIPTEFFVENKEFLGFREPKNSFSLIISAEPASLMVEKRGKGKMSLKQFCVNF